VTPPAERDPALSLIDIALREVPQRLPDIDTEAMHLVLLLHRVTNAVVYDLESSVHRPGGWSWSAFRVLFTLWVAGPLESKDAAARTGMSRPAVSSLTKTLVAQKLIRRDDAPGDGRSVVLSLTPKGKRELEVLYGAHNRRETMWANALSAAEREQLLALLAKLANATNQPWVNHRE
jgi:DNA-binding MarR family transcriptional regulator